MNKRNQSNNYDSDISVSDIEFTSTKFRVNHSSNIQVIDSNEFQNNDNNNNNKKAKTGNHNVNNNIDDASNNNNNNNGLYYNSYLLGSLFYRILSCRQESEPIFL